MRRDRTYLDANATEPLRPDARAAMLAALDFPGNASSVHEEGRHAKALIDGAREEVAALVGAVSANVAFVGNATEAANWALTPRDPDERLYVSAVEHPCVIAGGSFSRDRIRQVPVDPRGVVDLAALSSMLAADREEGGLPRLALMLANNETGVLQPVAEAAAIVHEFGGLIVCDAVQAGGRIPVSLPSLGADLLLLSSHKIGGPQGAGALVAAREDLFPVPLMKGGGQEKRRRAGTENLPAIVGFGVAAREAMHHLAERNRIAMLRDRLEVGLRSAGIGTIFAGEGVERLPNTVLFAVPGVASETAVIAFDLEGVSVSSGSACSSGKVAESHVLTAMGFPAGAGIRVSLPWDVAEADIDRFLDVWRAIHHRMVPGRAA
ncbi:cysteine desulfurase family protein [Afifella sp. IM 167]|uniref:cysteine desulfurase family protein n=1 Tax=Afifella sp. IM 167 TaxID=2033586 RepID=UPI001CCB463F|nr:cysteine desulfurase family protein [Afifella sp. IM 167]MBZ8132243.1 cysteine desulfurase [Afifella sp. IM 167]